MPSRDWSYSLAGKALALHTASPGSIPGTLFGAPNPGHPKYKITAKERDKWRRDSTREDLVVYKGRGL